MEMHCRKQTVLVGLSNAAAPCSLNLLGVYLYLGSLSPCSSQTNITADHTGKTNESIVQVEIAEGRCWNAEICEIGDELEVNDPLFPIEITLAFSKAVVIAH